MWSDVLPSCGLGDGAEDGIRSSCDIHSTELSSSGLYLSAKMTTPSPSLPLKYFRRSLVHLHDAVTETSHECTALVSI